MSTSPQDYALAIVPKITSSISIPCSLFIIVEALTDQYYRGTGTTAIQRSLVGMSVVDVLASSGWWLSNWGLPRDNTGDTPLATGNQASCNYQGFMLQLAISAPLYNCSLALYYLLVIKYSWTNERLLQIERYVHAFIITFGLSTAIAGVPLTMYNRVGAVCWVIGVPENCGQSSIDPLATDVPCQRGDHAWMFGLFLFYTPLWICVLFTVVAMILIYIQIRQTFGRLDNYGIAPPSNVQMNVVVTESYSENQPEQQQGTQRPEKKEEDDEKEEERDDDEDDDEVEEALAQTVRKFASTTTSRQDSQSPSIRSIHISTDASGSSRFGRMRVFSGHGGSFHAAASTTATATAFNPPSHSRRRHRHHPSSSYYCYHGRQQNKLKLFAIQACLYSVSFFITWLPSTIWSIASWFGAAHFGLDIAAATCEPLQGLWNLLIFLRQRRASQQRLRQLLQCCCCCSSYCVCCSSCFMATKAAVLERFQKMPGIANSHRLCRRSISEAATHSSSPLVIASEARRRSI